MPDLVYRAALPADCPRLAELIAESSGGTVDFLFHGLVPGLTPVQMVAQGLVLPGPAHSYLNAIVAEDRGEVAGTALSFPSEYHEITPEMRSFFPRGRLAHFADFYAHRIEGSLFLDALAVDARFRRQGVASELIARTVRKAAALGRTSVSLMVFGDNIPARRLYEKHGFKAAQIIRVDPHERLSHTGGCVLLRLELDGRPASEGKVP